MNATLASKTFTLIRRNARKTRTERARFSPDGNLVHVRFEVAVYGGGKVYRQLALDRETARLCWARLRNQGWQTAGEWLPKAPGCSISNYTGD